MSFFGVTIEKIGTVVTRFIQLTILAAVLVM